MFSQDTLNVLADLRANNTRDWFEENRKTFHAAVRDPAKAFAAALSHQLERHGQGPVTSKIFRINRDLRFSKDKTPYNTHVHMAFRSAESGSDGPAWMVGLEPGRLSLGAGVMGFTPPQLRKWRESVAGPAGEMLQRDLDHVLKQGASLSDPDLARVPKPYAQDHARGDLLRRKGLVVWRHSEDTQLACGPDGPARCADLLKAFAPVVIWLSETMQAAKAAS